MVIVRVRVCIRASSFTERAREVCASLEPHLGIARLEPHHLRAQKPFVSSEFDTNAKRRRRQTMRDLGQIGAARVRQCMLKHFDLRQRNEFRFEKKHT
jgi:hypothetical protein